MASGQLSPFPSCASGLGFMNTPDYRSATSLLTPTASACTISSLVTCGDGDSSSHTRSRTKTMQTKEILKSPQPHRFHLVLSGRRKTPELPSMPSRPSAQLRDGLGVPVSPGFSDAGEDMDLRHRGQDFYSPGASPLMPPAGIINRGANLTLSPEMGHFPVSDRRTSAHEGREALLSDTIEVGYSTFTGPSRPTSTTSASFTLVHDRLSKHLSSASGTTYKDMFCGDGNQKKTSFRLVDGFTPDSPLCDDDREHVEDAEPLELPSAPIVLPEPAYDDMTYEAESIPSIYSGDVAATQTNTSHPTSSTLDSLLSKYASDPALLGCTDDNSPAPASTLVSSPSTTATPLQPAPELDLPSPSKPTSARDRRRFALRRQAIYAEYGFQIALPDSDSGSSVKLLARSPAKGASMPAPAPGIRKGGTQIRAASAYVLSSGGSRTALSASTSGESRLRQSVGDPSNDADGMALFGSANDVDRLGRLSVQEDIMAASRNPLLEDRAGLRTSTPPRPTKLGSVGKRSHLAYDTGGSLGSASVSGLGFDTISGAHLDVPSDSVWRTGTSSISGSCSGKHSQHGWGSDSPWAPLQFEKRPALVPPTQRLRQSMCIPVSASEKSARLSAWEIDHGHHPILQDLLDEVDRAVEQWQWLAQLRAYRYV